MLTEEIIDTIKKIREEKGISRYRLAQLTGIHRSSIKRYEEGEIKKISFEHLLKICNALDIDIKELI